MRSFVLTGGAGFVGSYIVRELLKKNMAIYLLVRKKTNLSRLEDIKGQLTFFKINEIEHIFKNNRIDGIIHLATSYGRKGETLTDIINTNINLPIKLLEMSQNNGTKFFLNTDTFYESKMKFKDSLQFYTLTKEHFKLYAKRLCSLNNINFINIKLFHVYGDDDDETKFIPQMISMMLSPSPSLNFSSGKQKRDFVHVLDISKAYVLIIKHLKEKQYMYKNFELGTGKTISLRSLIKKAYELSKSKQKLIFSNKYNNNNEPRKIKADLKNINNLGWKPQISIEGGLKKLIKNEKKKKN